MLGFDYAYEMSSKNAKFSERIQIIWREWKIITVDKKFSYHFSYVPSAKIVSGSQFGLVTSFAHWTKLNLASIWLGKEAERGEERRELSAERSEMSAPLKNLIELLKHNFKPSHFAIGWKLTEKKPILKGRAMLIMSFILHRQRASLDPCSCLTIFLQARPLSPY